MNNVDTDNKSEQWFERGNIRRVTRNNAVRHNLVPKRGQQEYRYWYRSHFFFSQ